MYKIRNYIIQIYNNSEDAMVAVLLTRESRENVLLGRVLRAESPERGSGEGHSSGRARRGEAAPLAVLRQSLSGVQRGHSGTQGLA
ncbi:hypothetical protein CIK90_01335 [Prevotella sp. P5-126]|nr:hypothetical protein CIK90_01335 [Prevotella sp. P5-126]